MFRIEVPMFWAFREFSLSDRLTGTNGLGARDASKGCTAPGCVSATSSMSDRRLNLTSSLGRCNDTNSAVAA
jgi:hypothetical protein